MSEGIKDVIARIKAQESSKPKPEAKKLDKVKDIDKAIKETIEETENFDELVEKEDREEESQKAVDKSFTDAQKQQMIEMELLQNNGRYRQEQLVRLNVLNNELKEINQALVVIAQLLMKKNE